MTDWITCGYGWLNIMYNTFHIKPEQIGFSCSDSIYIDAMLSITLIFPLVAYVVYRIRDYLDSSESRRTHHV